MIVRIEQTKSSFDMQWNAIVDGKIIAVSNAPFERGMFQVEINYSGMNSHKLYYNPSDTTWGSKLSDRLSFKLFENQFMLGRIVGRTKKTGFLKAYAFYEFTFNEETYFGYEVGFGAKGLYLCIYRGEELIAIVEKELRVVNFKDNYIAYILDSKYLNVVLPFAIYYDVTSYGDIMEIAVVSVREKRVNTIQKELINKFDEKFIEQVKSMEVAT